jgi:uncharacterized protein YkwD
MNIKRIKLFLVLVISIYLVNGCVHTRRRYKKHYIPKHTTHHIGNVKVASNMNELDTISASTKPTMVYSYPKVHLADNVYFVNLKPYKNLVVRIINDVRAQAHAGPVRWNKYLSKAASAHARDMASNNFLGHLGSGKALDFARKGPGRGSNFYERIIFFGYPIRPSELAGEILTYTKDHIVLSREPMPHFKHAISNFLKSPAHATILRNKRFKDVGVAAYRAGEKIYWVLEFGESPRQY